MLLASGFQVLGFQGTGSTRVVYNELYSNFRLLGLQAFMIPGLKGLLYGLSGYRVSGF